MNPDFPVYIISKGRHDSRFTSRALEKMGVPYRIVVEEQERDLYASVIDPSKVIILDPDYKRRYDALMDLKPGQSKGSGPARNFVWEHSASEGHRRHWIMDDNIRWFYRLNRNLKTPVADGTMFKAMEDFVERYRNVGMAGPNYFMFASRKSRVPPLTFNTRIYSCILIRNDLPFRWRGRYNEDTILSLDVLKAGWGTILFNAFLQEKLITQMLKGGNTDAFYAEEGTGPKSQMLVDAHPDVASIAWRFNRIHHMVDYAPFRNLKLVLKPGVVIPDEVDDYGMALRKAKPGEKIGHGKIKGRNIGTVK